LTPSQVCGVVAYTQTLNAVVTSAIIGIGLNVETRPLVEPTPFVPRVAALRDFVPGPSGGTQAVMFDKLIRALDKNYRSLLDGKYHALLHRYCERSLVLGRKVTICSDESGSESEVIATGRVRALGENLEIFLEGASKPVWRGRLILED
jgi:biotin-(acetyl-CoA carboxylase) ligase